jgi:hypothetical protein
MASDTLANPNERLIRSEMFPERGALPENLDKLLFTDNVDRFVDKFLEYESNVAFLSFRGLREPLLMYKTLTPSFGSTLGNFCESSNKKLEEILRSIREHMVTTEYRGGDYVHYSDMRPGYAEHLPDLNDVITDVYKTFYQQLRTATDPIEVAAINEILNAYMSAVRPSET